MQFFFLFLRDIIHHGMGTNESVEIRTYNKRERLGILDNMLTQGKWITFQDFCDKVEPYCNKAKKMDLDNERAYGSNFRSDIRIIRAIIKDPLNHLDPDMLQTQGCKRQMSYRYKVPGFSILPYLEYQYTADDFKKLDVALAILKGNLPDNVYENLDFALRSRINYEHSKKTEVTVDYSENLRLAGRHWLPVLYQSICKTPLNITYGTFKGDSYTYQLHPYLLKLFNERWFVVGFRLDKLEPYWTVPLDRIQNVTLLPDIEFKPRPEHYLSRFDSLIGVTYDSRHELKLREPCPELITLGFHRNDAWGRSITKPIHSSQKIVKEFADGYGEMTLCVVPNNEMFMRILSLGECVSIVGPDHIRKGMASIIKTLNGRYSD